MAKITLLLFALSGSFQRIIYIGNRSQEPVKLQNGFLHLEVDGEQQTHTGVI